MDDSEQRLQELFQKLIHEYVERSMSLTSILGSRIPRV